jgi:hypothetical protein
MNASGSDTNEARNHPWPDLFEEAAKKKDTPEP